MAEKLNDQGYEANEKAKSLESAGDALRESLKETYEQNNETRSESKSEELESHARHEALEQAMSKEELNKPVEQDLPKPEKMTKQKPTKRELNSTYNKTMKTIQKEMNPIDRTFSKVIHNPVVDKVSDVTSKTVARPNLVIAGALGTILFGSIIYLVAKHYGYNLSGTEAIATFILGWAIGAIIEFARVGLLNKND